MRLEAGEIAQLPLSCALVDGQGRTIAGSPEWRGPAPGTVTFHTGYAQLLVAVAVAPPHLDALMASLLAELDAAALGDGADQGRLRLIAAGLRLVAGHPLGERDRAGAADVLRLAQAGVAARAPDLRVELAAAPPIDVPAAAAIALALVQLAVNAHRHECVPEVRLRVQDGPTFYVEWSSSRSSGVAIATHRHQERRERWGWGYVQAVADALGATALPPGPTGPDTQGACIGLGSVRLTLPVACIEQARVVRSTDAWDQDVGAAFGQWLRPELLALVQAATVQRGLIISQDLYRARTTGARTWLVMPPQSGLNRARDVLRGLAHEQALVRAPEPHATRIQALATLLGVALGDAAPTVPPGVWDEVLPSACAALGAVLPDPVQALMLPEPRVAAFLLAELGGRLVAVGDGLRLEPFPLSSAHVLLPALDRDERGRVRLS